MEKDQTAATAYAGRELQLVRIADLAATFVFAAQGALIGAGARLDPVGVLVLAFLTGLGGGIARDVLLGAGMPAAIRHARYAATVILAAIVGWVGERIGGIAPFPLLIELDAAGLALAAVAGTQKAIEYRTPPLVAIFVGAAGGVGGGLMRDIMLNIVPRVLRTDVYASAAMLGAVIVVIGHWRRMEPRIVAVLAGLACFTLRSVAYARGWTLPIDVR